MPGAGGHGGASQIDSHADGHDVFAGLDDGKGDCRDRLGPGRRSRYRSLGALNHGGVCARRSCPVECPSEEVLAPPPGVVILKTSVAELSAMAVLRTNCRMTPPVVAGTTPICPANRKSSLSTLCCWSRARPAWPATSFDLARELI